jgi:hypothetical protein
LSSSYTTVSEAGEEGATYALAGPLIASAATVLTAHVGFMAAAVTAHLGHCRLRIGLILGEILRVAGAKVA